MRRLREARGLRLMDMAYAITTEDGKSLYSPGHLSRIERGWPAASFYIYLAISAQLEMDPGRLLGADGALLDVSEAEMTLVRALRELEIEPHEALAALVQARSTAIRNSSPSMRVGSPAPSNSSDVASVSPDT